MGEVHAAILQALGCIGVITNGAVRDLQAVRRTGRGPKIRNGTTSSIANMIPAETVGSPAGR